MPDTPRLTLLRDGMDAYAVVIGPAGIRVGRAPDNDLVLTDAEISWGHAEFWLGDGQVYVRDRGSSNGTFLNGWRVRVPLAVGPDDLVRLGTGTEFRVVGALHAAESTKPVWFVEDLVTRVRLPLTEVLPSLAPPGHDGVLWVGDTRIRSGNTFAFGGRTYRLSPSELIPVPTAGAATGGWPYRLHVRLEGSTGPEATIAHRTQPRVCRIRAENRAVLLYILARRAIDDRRRNVARPEAGWCTDDEVVTGVWGREGATMDPNGLHVLVHRVRRDIAEAGLDPAFLEKRQRALRIALIDIEAA